MFPSVSKNVPAPIKRSLRNSRTVTEIRFSQSGLS
jgi:hypothetical protein